MARVYVSQAAVDRWLSAGQADLTGDVLRIQPQGGVVRARSEPTPIALYIHPAVYFEGVESADGDSSDPLGMLGCVKTSQELAQLGAEHFDTSVVVGEHAYAVEPGFVAIPLGSDGNELRPDRAQWIQLVAQLETLV